MGGSPAGHSWDCGEGGRGGKEGGRGWQKGGLGEISGLGHPWSLTPVPYPTHIGGRINPGHHAPASLVETPLGFLPSGPSMAMRSGHLITGTLAGNG